MDISQAQSPDYPPRLYPEGSSNIEAKEINHNFHSGEFPRVREAIGHDVWDELEIGPLGVIAKLAKRKSVWSDPLPTESIEPDDQYKEFWELLKVPLRMGPKLDELKATLDDCPSWDFVQRKWLGLLFLQTMGLYAFHHNSRIPFESAKRVFDDEAMMSYPWGRIGYEVLVNSIKMLDPQGRTYTINGMVEVLLIWVYESVTCFGERFGSVVNNEDNNEENNEDISLPLLRWRGKRTRASFEHLFSEEIREHDRVRVRNMVMKKSAEEMFPQSPVKGHEEKKRMKDGVSSEAEPPTKKQKKVKKQKEVNTSEGEAVATGKACSEKEGREDLPNNEALRIQKTVDDIVNERLKVLGIGQSFIVNNTQEKTLPSPLNPPQNLPHTLLQKSVNSQLATVDKTPTDTDAEKDEADAKEVAAKKVAKKKDAATPAKKDHLDFLTVSPAKDVQVPKHPAYKRGCKVNPKPKDEAAQKAEAGQKAEAVLKKKEATELKKKEAAELRKQTAAAKRKLKEESADKKKKEAAAKKQKDNSFAGVTDSSLADVTDDMIAAQNEVFPESDVEPEEVARSARIKEYRERTHVAAYMNVLSGRSMRDPTPFWSKRIAFIDSCGYEKLVNGLLLEDSPTNLKWVEDVDHLYGVLQVKAITGWRFTWIW
ncbi:uncharacterized protein LOC108834210 [Raphanus sativus]|uniref:Uncharacterized protein LOC108834210 n=1 Tax=Raphanus sativus TaxID=3726 RepID=A0A6J0LTG5_RAPSA|nr:uncharacterized protein LOC108834210 [Raphanus sativus]